MAHESHTEDTTFIVAESDFVFNHSDATTHLQWLGEEEERACNFGRYSEIADAIPEGAARQDCLRQLTAYEAAIKQDKNAPWPADSEEGPGAPDEAPQWHAAKIDFKERVSYAFSGGASRPPKSQWKSVTTCRICKRFSRGPPGQSAADSCGAAGTPVDGRRHAGKSARNRQAQERNYQ